MRTLHQHNTTHIKQRTLLRGLTNPLALMLAFILIAMLFPSPAHAHGSMERPLSRVYNCFLEGPESPQSDACRAAVAASGTQQLYDWNEINQLPNGDHQAFVPDGELCGGGRDLHAGMNLARSDWETQSLIPDENGNFEFIYLATAPHSTKYFEFYVTKDGYDPTQPLKWSDLEDDAFCTITEVDLQAQRYRMTCPVPTNKTGKHVIYNIWQRSDSPEAFYACIDIDFDDDSTDPTPTPVVTPTPVPPTPTPLPDDGGDNGSCPVTYTVTSEWFNGFVGEVTLTNNSGTDIDGWQVDWTFTGNQQISSLWNGSFTQNVKDVSVTNLGWNSSLPNGTSLTVGFQATMTGFNDAPVNLRLNHPACQGTNPPAPTPTSTPITLPSATPTTVPTATPTTIPTTIPTSTPTQITPPTNTPLPTSTSVTPPTATSAPGSSVCQVDYTVTSQWNNGFNANVIITNNGDAPIDGWVLTWVFLDGQQITNLWNGSYTQQGAAVTVNNLGWNQRIAVGSSRNIGFGGQYNGDNGLPTTFTLNGVTCNGDAPAPTNTPQPAPTNTPAPPTPVPPTDVPPTDVPPTPVPPTTEPPTTVPPTTEPPTTDKEVIAYFAQWGVYGKNYHVKNIVDSGSADKITIINYAFGNVVNGECIMVTQTGVMDAYADYQKSYTAAQSVDGVADTWNQPVRGNFNQLMKLKAMYPHIKVMISLGGWTWSAGFHEASKTPESRQRMVESCIDIYINGNLPFADNAGGVGAAAGLFDGIDIDWEYPGAPGNGNPHGPEDTRNFTLLLEEFRRQLDAIDPSLMLTIATGAGKDKYDLLELDQIHHSLDYINIMTYDFHGAWESLTGHNAPIYNSPDEPYNYPLNTYSLDSSVQGYISAGVPASKIVVGIPFYGRGWRGVPNVNNGLWQSATGAAQGVWEAGFEDYKVIKNMPYPIYRDAIAGTVWKYNGDIFWSYDDAQTITAKMDYIHQHNLGGAMIWSLDGDDSSGSLMTAVQTGMVAASARATPSLLAEPVQIHRIFLPTVAR